MKNPEGRLVETNWPDSFPEKSVALHLLLLMLKEQVRIERNMQLLNEGTKEPVYLLSPEREIRWNVHSTMFARLAGIFLQKIYSYRHGTEPIEFCDMGGGAGDLYRSTLNQIPYDLDTSRIRCTVTNLVPPTKAQITENTEYVYSWRNACVELPPKDFHQKFDLIVCQNSVFYWTRHPELALSNLVKMLKKDGVLIFNFSPTGLATGEFEPFDTLGFLQKQTDLEFLVPVLEGRSYAVVLARKGEGSRYKISI